MALLCKVQTLPLAKQSGYTFKEALTHKNTYYIIGCLELAVIFYPVHIFITIFILFLSPPSLLEVALYVQYMPCQYGYA